VSQDIAAAIAGRGSVDQALAKGQQMAAAVAKKYQ
jgi:sorbitol/mannitol transport system substrate-binding protein